MPPPRPLRWGRILRRRHRYHHPIDTVVYKPEMRRWDRRYACVCVCVAVVQSYINFFWGCRAWAHAHRISASPSAIIITVSPLPFLFLIGHYYPPRCVSDLIPGQQRSANRHREEGGEGRWRRRLLAAPSHRRRTRTRTRIRRRRRIRRRHRRRRSSRTTTTARAPVRVRSRGADIARVGCRNIGEVLGVVPSGIVVVVVAPPPPPPSSSAAAGSDVDTAVGGSRDIRTYR